MVLKVSFLFLISYFFVNYSDGNLCSVKQTSKEKVMISCNDEYFDISIEDTVFSKIFYSDVIDLGFSLGSVYSKNSDSTYSYSCRYEKSANIDKVIFCKVFNADVSIAKISVSSR